LVSKTNVFVFVETFNRGMGWVNPEVTLIRCE
jgi:hypothetical protein